MDTGLKRENEGQIISRMIAIYCKGNHKGKGLCPDCAGLEKYARERVDWCPYMETKTFCSSCKTPCYKPEMREKIRAVMRYSGPRFIFTNPVLVVKHAYYSRRKTNETTEVQD